ncbi:hypothetical protein GCM10009765_33470 [Fodinicola feengrottensis]|uniref:Ferritin-like domain-containing protein n=2 Tax=Fodinicola feengrottensis TaxID=435914 RepID=A0ABN2H4R4_9ACTN
MLTAVASLTVAGGTGLVAGCTGEPAAPAAPDPVTTALTSLLKAEQALLAGYDSAIGGHSSLADQLAGVRADHAAHVKALAALLARRDPDPDPSPSPSGQHGSVTPDGSLAGGSSSSARQTLAGLEKQQTTAAVAGCLIAADAEAALLASLAAAEASHLEVLT